MQPILLVVKTYLFVSNVEPGFVTVTVVFAEVELDSPGEGDQVYEYPLILSVPNFAMLPEHKKVSLPAF